MCNTCLVLLSVDESWVNIESQFYIFFQGGEGTFWDVERVQEGKNVEFFALLLCQNIEFRKIGEVEVSCVNVECRNSRFIPFTPGLYTRHSMSAGNFLKISGTWHTL